MTVLLIIIERKREQGGEKDALALTLVGRRLHDNNRWRFSLFLVYVYGCVCGLFQ